MAISGCTSILWRSKDLSFDTITYLIQIWFERRRTKLPSGSTRARPKVVIDANLVAYGHLSKKSPIMPDGAVEIIARAFSEKGIDVSIVCDHPTKRHPSKRATCERQGKRIKAGFKRIHASMELQSLLALPEESRDRNQIKELQKTIRKCENAENRSLPEDFVENLSAFVEHYGSSDGKGNIEFEQAPTQADPCAAKDVIDSAVDAVISGDSDFSMYVGPSGIDGFGDLMVKDLKLSSRKGIAEAGKIVTGQKAVANRIDEILGPHLNLDSVFVGGAANVPKYPMFDGVADPMAVGCDACPGGVDGIGPKKAMELYNQIKTIV